jgi:hypothetical protein
VAHEAHGAQSSRDQDALDFTWTSAKTIAVQVEQAAREAFDDWIPVAYRLSELVLVASRA